MKYRAFATDYDGTLADEGRVDDETIAALRRVRGAGLKLVLVTGRQVTDLITTFAHPDAFDVIVAENGAVLYDPSTRAIELLAAPAPPALLRRLEQANVPLSVGRSIVATVTAHEREVLDAIHALGLHWHVVFNKDAVMALPSGVTKATGLSAALTRLGIAAPDLVGIGDAENDQAFLRFCGLSAAVANALDEVKAIANLTTAGACGAGVRELIDQLLADPPRALAGPG